MKRKKQLIQTVKRKLSKLWGKIQFLLFLRPLVALYFETKVILIVDKHNLLLLISFMIKIALVLSTTNV